MNSKPVVLSAGTALIGLIAGALIGHFATPRDDAITEQQKSIISYHDDVLRDDGKKDRQFLLDNINRDNLKENLRILTEKPHLAGTEQDEILAELFENRFKESGFDWVKKVPYNVLLSRPDFDNHNSVSLLKDGLTFFQAATQEKPIHKDDADPLFVPAFNAFTPPGNVRSNKVIYVNYGRVEDFTELKKLGIDATDSIVIVRYGKIFRGNKVDNAYKNGAKGCIIFSDPEDVAADGTDEKDVYDNTWWLPGTGMQRGTTFLGDGDPLTPGWPSTVNAYRLDESEADLPKIPTQPIGYADAKVILEKMKGNASPKSWHGGLKTVEYNLGPELEEGFEVRIISNNKNEQVKSYNVIGVLRGSIEPDRYVLIGNHRDAWGYGAADPSSGSSQMLETARVLGELVKTGWRPKRSIVFCSWGAEEYGLIGSYEFVEEHINKLQERAIAYINTDTCASGPIIQPNGSPLLWDLISDVTKSVPGVLDSSSTVFEEWVQRDKIDKPNLDSYPKFNTPGSGSDHAPFIFYGGIPVIDVWFRRDKTVHNISTYPAYHTGYETFHMMSTLMDPEFKIHQACGRVASLLIKDLADSKILPLRIDKFPNAMSEGLQNLKKEGIRDKLMNIYNKYVYLEEAVDELKATADQYIKMLQDKELSVIEVRRINDQLMRFEQTFILPEGLPNRPIVRHAIFASSQFDSYAASGFPGISDLLHKIDELSGAERIKREKTLSKHISDLTIMTNRAISLLKDFEVFD